MSGWDNGLCQDYNKDLGRWFANRLGARLLLKEIFMDVYKLKPKRVVHYRTDVDFFVKMGKCALVTPVDHPNCSNTKPVITSPVMQFNPIDGGFETINTIYRPFNGELQ